MQVEVSSAPACSSAGLPIIQTPKSSFSAADTSSTVEGTGQNLNLVPHSSSSDKDARNLPQLLKANAPTVPITASSSQDSSGRERESRDKKKGQELLLSERNRIHPALDSRGLPIAGRVASLQPPAIVSMTHDPSNDLASHFCSHFPSEAMTHSSGPLAAPAVPHGACPQQALSTPQHSTQSL